MYSPAALEPTVILQRSGSAHPLHIPLPLPPVTGNATQDRLVMHAYRRLKGRLSREARTAPQC
ncbi:MAG: hypothetical protein ACFCBW_15640, partial [Candidatus Competibacterales bacterium]